MDKKVRVIHTRNSDVSSARNKDTRYMVFKSWKDMLSKEDVAEFYKSFFL